MRRWLVFLLMLMLPLQSSIAAVAAYCMHEKDFAAQQHLGHHADHEHAAAAQPENDTGGAMDLDCPACVAHCALAVAPADRLMQADVSFTPNERYDGSMPDPFPDHPFRPPLPSLA